MPRPSVSRLIERDAAASMRPPQRPQKVPPAAISEPQFGQFIVCSCWCTRPRVPGMQLRRSTGLSTTEACVPLLLTADCFLPLTFQELLGLVQPALFRAVFVCGCGLDCVDE